MGKLEIQIVLPPETLGALNKLTEALNKIAGQEMVIGYSSTPEPQAPQKTAKAPEPAPKPEEAPAPTAEPEAPQAVDPEALLNEIRALIRQNAKSHREGIKALLTEYGATKASLLPAETRASFYEKLKGVLGA